MRNNILRRDLDRLIDHLKSEDPILTHSVNVKKFEEDWSEWLGVKHSVFVNSGASANLISMALLKLKFPEGGEVIVPPLTWVSDIASVIQCGFTPVFADIDPQTLGMDTELIIKKVNKNTRCVFITHIQGFNSLTDQLIDFLKLRGIPLIEDVCESHGAKHKSQKLGSIGWISNFSFYYAHHMSTIEGGMICMDDEMVYQQARMLRSHGMVRESSSEPLRRSYVDAYPDLNPDFIFAFPSFNMRGTEIGGILGRSQLPRLDENIERRNENHLVFLDEIDNSRFRVDFFLEGASNYAFNLILREPDIAATDRLMAHMRSNGIEFRRGSAGGGNHLRQPYLRGIVSENEWINYPETEHVHFHGFYVGNYPDLKLSEVRELCEIINSAG